MADRQAQPQPYYMPFLETNALDINEAIAQQGLNQQGLMSLLGQIAGGFTPHKDISGNYMDPFNPEPTGIDKFRANNPRAFTEDGVYKGYPGHGAPNPWIQNPDGASGPDPYQQAQAQQVQPTAPAATMQSKNKQQPTVNPFMAIQNVMRGNFSPFPFI